MKSIKIKDVDIEDILILIFGLIFITTLMISIASATPITLHHINITPESTWYINQSNILYLHSFDWNNSLVNIDEVEVDVLNNDDKIIVFTSIYQTSTGQYLLVSLANTTTPQNISLDVSVTQSGKKVNKTIEIQLHEKPTESETKSKIRNYIEKTAKIIEDNWKRFLAGLIIALIIIISTLILLMLKKKEKS